MSENVLCRLEEMLYGPQEEVLTPDYIFIETYKRVKRNRPWVQNLIQWIYLSCDHDRDIMFNRFWHSGEYAVAGIRSEGKDYLVKRFRKNNLKFKRHIVFLYDQLEKNKGDKNENI